MSIYEHTKDYGSGQVFILWDGDRPSDDEFLDLARGEYGVIGRLEVEDPWEYLGIKNPGTATVTANV